MYIKENLSKKSSFINKQLLNAPKQNYKISFIKLKPFTLNDKSNDLFEIKEHHYLDFSFQNNHNILYNTKSSDDFFLNKQKNFINNYSKNDICIDNCNIKNHNKGITIIDILKRKYKN